MGKVQSPINIRRAPLTHLEDPEFGYQPAGLSMLNDCDHWTIKVNVPAGSKLKFGGRTYTLVQFHFHEPAEEAFRGHRAAMVVHLVHQADDDKSVLVVAAEVMPGKENGLIKTLWDHIPPKGEPYDNPEIKINASDLLPPIFGFYTFAGSLTTPKCDEGVTWVVLKSPIYFSPDQIAKYKTQYHGTARPLQPVNGRKIEQSK